ncbi:MAG: hypothetical protein JO322_12185 [Candidatus Eremiobacteraeota bacterium]|nr:hypothetical protein [Candidatus Eremiobacteraeota bacterium]
MIALHGGRVIREPHAEPAPATVLIEGGTIAAVASVFDTPSQTRTIDCSGCTIVAGFQNSHVHFFERKWASAAEIPAEELGAQLQDFERFGFTAVFDLSSAYENTSVIRRRIDAREVCGPRIFTTGPGIVPPGFDLPDAVVAVLGPMNVQLPSASDPAEARRAARRCVTTGIRFSSARFKRQFNSLHRGENVAARFFSAWTPVCLVPIRRQNTRSCTKRE